MQTSLIWNNFQIDSRTSQFFVNKKKMPKERQEGFKKALQLWEERKKRGRGERKQRLEFTLFLVHTRKNAVICLKWSKAKSGTDQKEGAYIAA